MLASGALSPDDAFIMKAKNAPIFPVMKNMARAFSGYAGARVFRTLALIFAGAVVEGFGLILLVPLFAVVFRHTMPSGRAQLFLARMFDHIHVHSAAGQLAVLICLFCVLLVIRGVIIVARDRELSRLRIGFVQDLRGRIVSQLTHADWHVLSRLKHARLTHLLGSDIQQIGLAAHVFSQGVMNAVMLCVQIALAFALAPVLGLITCVLMVFGALAMVPLMRQANMLGRYITGSNLNLMHQSLQFLGGLKLAMSQNLQDGFSRQFHRQLETQADMQIAFSVQQTRNRQIILSLISVAGALLVLAGFTWLHVTPPVLLAFLVILMRMSGPASQLSQGAQQLSNILPAFEKVAELESELGCAPDAAPAAAVVPETPVPECGGQGVALTHVRYIHPDASDAQGVQDVSLSLMPGEFLGIEGQSGAGKTTLADLITGLYPPQSGAIIVDGQLLTGPVLAEWRARIGYVAQDPFLISASLRQNLSWMRPGVTDDDIWQTLECVGAGDLVRSLTDRLDSDMGERGGLVSGGERQRIALARALLRKPDLLVLDEATNAIDRAGEKTLLKTLADMKNRPAIVLISHRAESMAFCDRVVTMAAGRLV